MLYLLHRLDIYLVCLPRGVALKSLTGSTKVVEVLNCYGHCADYNAVEEIERELTFNATKTQMETPNGMMCF